MRHDHIIQGYRYLLRPVGDSDVHFILELRTNPKLNRFLHPTPNDAQRQLLWLSEYYQRDNDYYFVVERSVNHQSEGLISVYNIDWNKRCGEWGRWVLVPNSLAAVESVLLIFRFAFEIINLDCIYSRTIIENHRVVSFHDSCGIPDRRIVKDCFQFGGRSYDAVEHRVDKEYYRVLEPKLSALAQRLSEK